MDIKTLQSDAGEVMETAFEQVHKNQLLADQKNAAQEEFEILKQERQQTYDGLVAIATEFAPKDDEGKPTAGEPTFILLGETTVKNGEGSDTLSHPLFAAVKSHGYKQDYGYKLQITFYVDTGSSEPLVATETGSNTTRHKVGREDYLRDQVPAAGTKDSEKLNRINASGVSLTEPKKSILDAGKGSRALEEELSTMQKTLDLLKESIRESNPEAAARLAETTNDQSFLGS